MKHDEGKLLFLYYIFRNVILEDDTNENEEESIDKTEETINKTGKLIYSYRQSITLLLQEISTGLNTSRTCSSEYIVFHFFLIFFFFSARTSDLPKRNSSIPLGFPTSKINIPSPHISRVGLSRKSSTIKPLHPNYASRIVHE
jgi:hypothetical protein